MSYYLLSVDSLIDTFSMMDTAGTFTFTLRRQNQRGPLGGIFGGLQEGDEVLVYRRAPIAKVNVLLKAEKVALNNYVFSKKLEVSEGADIAGLEFSQNPEDMELVPLSESVFRQIYRLMIHGLWMEEASGGDADSAEQSTAQYPAREPSEKRVTKAGNVLLYGVPGVGKSHEIHQKYCQNADLCERVVFHPDYTYSDFVGQILPRVEGDKLKYVFTPGPFTRMLRKAWDNPGEEYFLVIEEINRGNAPAIFGEIFQLLDRKTEDSHKYIPSEYGESEYGIANYDIALAVYQDEKHEVRIPSNLWILATMNTADQNVFTLDTAFQRRWDMHHIKNDVWTAEHATEQIEGTGIVWGAFATVINDMVSEAGFDMAGSEDKRLGAYFVKRSELAGEKFPEKVLKYLWDDAFKMDREAIFGDKFRSLEEVLETYGTAAEDKLEAVLRAEVYRKMAAASEAVDSVS